MVWYGMVWYGMVWNGMVWYGMVWYGMVFKYLYSAPQQPWANRGAFGSISSKKKRQVLRSDKDVERLDDKREARAGGGRRFHAKRRGNNGKRSRHAMAMVVLVRGTKSSRLSRERIRYIYILYSIYIYIYIIYIYIYIYIYTPSLIKKTVA